jgi:hypothetical protein
MTAPRTTIAGIAIPDSALAPEATEFVRDPSKGPAQGSALMKLAT